VLKNINKIPAATKGVNLMVRDAADILLLQGEGVEVDSIGRLKSLENFWDFSPECQKKYEDKLAAAASAAASASSSASASASASAAAGAGVFAGRFEDSDEAFAEATRYNEINNSYDVQVKAEPSD
jgi:hypothetical protein